MLLQLLNHEAVVAALRLALALGVSLFVISNILVSWRYIAWPLTGLRQLGTHKRSNLVDQYDTRYADDNDDDNKTDQRRMRIKALYIHPIKSCRRIELDRALLTKSGFAYDRCFAFAAEEQHMGPDGKPGWRMISQRTKPQMSQIHVELWVASKDSDQTDHLSGAGGQLVISFPLPDKASFFERFRMSLETWRWSIQPRTRFQVPLMPTIHQITKHNIKYKSFIIHDRLACGLDLSTIPEVAFILPRLKVFLNIPPKRGLTLLRCTADTLHRTTDNLAPLERVGTPAMHGFTDEQPLHVVNLASVHATSLILPAENQPLNALRFRANMYICGPSAYGEEHWKRFRIQPQNALGVSAKISVVCRTPRCTMPNVNPDTGIVARENPTGDRKKGKPQPSTTLVQCRMVETQYKGALGYMGIHCVPEDSSLKEAKDQNTGLYIEVGDTIEVLERGMHIYGSTGNDY